VNVSENTTLTASLRQARSKFTKAYTKVSNTSLTDFNISISGQTFQSNTTFSSPAEYNATFSKTGWYNVTEAFNASLDNQFKGVYDHRATFNVEDKVTNQTINNATITLSYQDQYEETQNTTNGTLTFNVEQNQSYNITVDGDQISRETFQYNATNNKTKTESLQVFQERSAQFTIRNTNDRNKITDDVQIRLQSINLGTEQQLTKTTSDGEAYFTLLTPARYRVTLNASDYTDNQYYITIPQEQSQTYTLYISEENNTAPVTFTVIDQATNTLENVKVSIQRYYNATSTYETITEEITNLEGQATLRPPADNEYYQVTFTQSGATLRVTEPFRLEDNQYQIQVNTAGDFLQDAQRYNALDYQLTYNPATVNFKAEYTQDGQQNKVCLKLTKEYTTIPAKTVNKSCTTSPTGTILLQRNSENVTQQATLTYQTPSNTYTIQTLTKSFKDALPSPQTGVFAQIIITLIFAAASLTIQPSAALTAVPASLYIGWWIGLITIPIGAITGLLVAGMTATYGLSGRL
jgi:hypothetical protein